MASPTPRPTDSRKSPRPAPTIDVLVPAAAAPAQAAAEAAGDTPVTSPEPRVDASTLDAAISGWTGDTSRAQLAWGFSVAAALMAGAKAARDVQREAAERAENACRQAGERLQSTRDWTQAAAVQSDWLREQADEALRTWSRLGEIALRSGAETVERAVEGWSQASSVSLSGMGRWAQVQAAMPATPEALQAEAEHITNPLTAGPLAWPAQEAVRQGMSFASSLWNDWVDWSQRSTSRTGAKVH